LTAVAVVAASPSKPAVTLVVVSTLPSKDSAATTRGTTDAAVAPGAVVLRGAP